MENELEVVDSVLEGLTEVELRDTIVRTVREINRLKADAKGYAKSTREVIKSLEQRNEQCLELIEKLKSNPVGQ